MECKYPEILVKEERIGEKKRRLNNFGLFLCKAFVNFEDGAYTKTYQPLNIIIHHTTNALQCFLPSKL